VPAPLQYKRRVRLPEADEPSLPRPRRALVLPVGLAAWLASVGFAWGVKAGTIPVTSWLEPSPETSANVPRQRSIRRPPMTEPVAPPSLAPPSLAPMEPVIAADESVPEPAPSALASLSGPVQEPTSQLPPRSAAAKPVHSPTITSPFALLDRPAPLPEPVRLPGSLRLPEPPRSESPRSVALEAPAPAGGTSVGMSCEAAAATYSDEIVMGADRGPADLTADDYARVLNRGSWFASCGVPANVALDVCVAVQNGRARGVTVRATPRHAAVESCVARAASRISFPSHPRLDVARSRFKAQ
jgi:hypothetical protein